MLVQGRESDIFNYARKITRLNQILCFYENSLQNFEKKWTPYYNNALVSNSSIAVTNTLIPISNDPNSIGTPLMDLNTIIGKLNSASSTAMFVTDASISLSVSHNPVYRDIGFVEDFVIVVYLVYQNQSNGEFSGIPKLKDVLDLFEDDGVTPIAPTPITPFNRISPNITPILKLELRNSASQAMPICTTCLSFTEGGAYLAYPQNVNSNSFPLAGGMYLFATKSQTIIRETFPELEDGEDFELSTDEVQALKNIDNEVERLNKQRESLRRKSSGSTRNPNDEKKRSDNFEFDFLTETKFLSVYNRVLMNV